MEKTLKILSWVGKAVGLAASVDLTPMHPKYGPIVFFAASLLKDTINRLGDFLDDGKANGSFGK
jgi:hypothetical protein